MLPLLFLILAPLASPLLALLGLSVTDLVVQHAETGWQFLGQVVGRLVILLPAAWYVRFASIRHASLFRLREHYNYKYSMAASVEGFKQQAKSYEEEIAAMTLGQLAFNPADRLAPSNSVQEGKPPSLLLDYFHKLLERRMKALEAPKD